jgi:hypothetical protein
MAIVASVVAVDACSSTERNRPDMGPPAGGAGGGGAAGGANGGSGGQSGAGQAGQTSVGGAAGAIASGSAGVGGAQAACHAPVNCIEGLCGNGMVNTCTAPSGPPPCYVQTFYEQCDGADFADASCTSLGYGSGTLACSSTCSFDTTACYTCASASPAVAGCNVISSTAFSDPSMATTDTETALVWIDQPSGAPLEIGFALLSAGLDVITTGHIADPAIAADAQGNVSAQIAALPTGWLVLAVADASLTMYSLDSAGNVVGHSVLDPMANGFDVGRPILVSQPNGGPLVIWEVINIYAAVVSADGLSTTTPVQIPANSYGGVGPLLTSATFAAGAFQAVINEDCTAGACLRIVSIAPDGTVAGSFQPPGLLAPGGARLASGADDLRLLYSADCGTTMSNFCLMWQRFSSTGTALSSPVLVDGSSTSASSVPSSSVAVGADTYLPSFKNPSSVLVHLSSDGTAAADPQLIATVAAAGAVIVRQGSDLIAGWVDDTRERIEVARLVP